jgi:glycosyltransferase involved in cell wall biosynthesis
MSHPRRIAVNLLWIVPGQVGGSEEYLVRQLRGLADVDPSAALTLYVQPAFAVAHAELVERFPTVVSPSFGDSRARRIAAESSWLHSATASAALTHHGGGAAPMRTHRPYVLTLHDLQYRTFPQYFSATKRAWFDAVLPRSVRRAAVVAVPTTYVRTTVVDTWDVDPELVRVVPHGFDPPPSDRATPEPELRARFQLGEGPVVVYPAVTHPHKQHRLLVDLMERSWRDPSLRMVFIGGVGLAEDDTVSDDDRIRRLGRVTDADRDGLLRMAEAMVFPSSYEGFGAPLVEAMALGCPVICSDATCIPEVVGDAAVVRPLDHDAWVDVLDVVAADRAGLIARGLQRAAQFSAHRSAVALAECYQRGMA